MARIDTNLIILFIITILIFTGINNNPLTVKEKLLLSDIKNVNDSNYISCQIFGEKPYANKIFSKHWLTFTKKK